MPALLSRPRLPNAARTRHSAALLFVRAGTIHMHNQLGSPRYSHINSISNKNGFWAWTTTSVRAQTLKSPRQWRRKGSSSNPCCGLIPEVVQRNVDDEMQDPFREA